MRYLLLIALLALRTTALLYLEKPLVSGGLLSSAPLPGKEAARESSSVDPKERALPGPSAPTIACASTLTPETPEAERPPDIPVQKPALLFIPGFDGTLISPFLQFPELGETFDVTGCVTTPDDLSTFGEIEEFVRGTLKKLREGDGDGAERDVYLCGESFGGLVAASVMAKSGEELGVKGLALVNPATNFANSTLYERGKNVSKIYPPFYVFWLLSLLPLFIDENSFPSLLRIISGEHLPGIIDTEEREAYMGR